MMTRTSSPTFAPYGAMPSRRHAGTQFDPELVELFCDLYAARAPEPDATVLALSAADATDRGASLVLPDATAKRAARKRRRVDADGGTADEALAASRTMAPDGALGVARPGGQVAPLTPPTSAGYRRTDSAAG